MSIVFKTLKFFVRKKDFKFVKLVTNYLEPFKRSKTLKNKQDEMPSC